VCRYAGRSRVSLCHYVEHSLFSMKLAVDSPAMCLQGATNNERLG